MDPNATKNILEAALLAANSSLSFDSLAELFSARGVEVDRKALRDALGTLAEDYSGREIELKETASGYRIQVRSSAREWLQPLFEERAPRYTRALLETLALIAYRQPITRAEIEDVRGVAVSSNIIRTLTERGWIRVVGHRDVAGKPSMLGTTREFLDYFGLKRLEDLPPLAEIRELGPGSDPQSDLVDELAAVVKAAEGTDEAEGEAAVIVDSDDESEAAASDTEARADGDNDSDTQAESNADADTVATAEAQAPVIEASAEAQESAETVDEANVVPIRQSEA